MKKTLTFVLFFLIAFSCDFFAMGMGDWLYVTNYKTQISDDGMRTAKGEELRDLNRWYFYENHIIGEYGGGYFANHERREKFFVLNEKNTNLVTFESRSSWEEYLDLNNLRPVLWTRWYDDQYPLFYIIFFNAFFFFSTYNIFYDKVDEWSH